MYEEKKLILDIEQWLDEQGFHYDARSDELIAEKCFHCGREKKLYINKTSGVYNCFRCGEKGGPISLVMNISDVDFKKAKELCFGVEGPISASDKLMEEDWEKTVNLSKRKGREKEESDPIEIPPSMYPITKKDTLYINYLKKRGFSDEMIETYPIYVWKNRNRVVFTIERDGDVYGYMARDILGSQEPKTLNSRGSFRTHNFWNYDIVKDKKTICIAEGVFSAVKCGPWNSIALLGKVATPEQIQLLSKTAAEKIILCLDYDTDEDQDKIYEELSVYYPGAIYSVDFPPFVEIKEEFKNIDLINQVNAKFGINLELKDGLLVFSSKDKKVIKKFFKDKKIVMGTKIYTDFVNFLNKSDYKDAGDYSYEEMEEFIKNAKIYKKKIVN